MDSVFRCVIHGSFRKHFRLINSVCSLFREAGIDVLAPQGNKVIGLNEGFALLEGEEYQDPRLVELMYLHNLKRLGPNGFSYFVNPEGYIGKSTSYELGIAQLTNTNCYYYSPLKDHPGYLHKNSVWKPDDLSFFIKENNRLPSPRIHRNEKILHKLWTELMVPGSVVAVGGIIEYNSRKTNREKEILLVKTHKWGGKYSVVGGRVRRNERLDEALIREVKEETGLKSELGGHIATFDQIKNSGYFTPSVQHIFIDKVIKVDSKKVRLNEEAQEYVWITPREALKDLPIEPNARHTLELYANLSHPLAGI